MDENKTLAELTVSGFETREVMMVDYKFNQATDLEGQLSGIPRGGRVTIRVKAHNDGNNELLHWMLAESDPRDISVKISNTDDKPKKELVGKNCYCVHYKEMWEEGQSEIQKDAADDAEQKLTHYEEIQITCQQLINGPVSYKNPWK